MQFETAFFLCKWKSVSVSVAVSCEIGLSVGACGSLNSKCLAFLESVFADLSNISGESDGSERGATLEGICAEILNTLVAAYSGKCGATPECAVANGGNGCGNVDRGKSYALIESVVIELNESLGELDGFDIVAKVEGTGTDLGNRIGNNYLGKVGAAGKCPVTDLGYGVGNGYLCDAVVVVECLGGDAGDLDTLVFSGDNYLVTVKTAVISDDLPGVDLGCFEFEGGVVYDNIFAFKVFEVIISYVFVTGTSNEAEHKKHSKRNREKFFHFLNAFLMNLNFDRTKLSGRTGHYRRQIISTIIIT